MNKKLIHCLLVLSILLNPLISIADAMMLSKNSMQMPMVESCHQITENQTQVNNNDECCPSSICQDTNCSLSHCTAFSVLFQTVILSNTEISHDKIYSAVNQSRHNLFIPSLFKPPIV